jgi:hypothetical protein
MKKFIKRTIITLFLIVTGFTRLTAQQNLKGCVLGAGDRPLSAATILLLRTKDSALLRSAVTDSTGAFGLSLPNGNKFLLRISSIGYTTDTRLLDSAEIAHGGGVLPCMNLSATATQLQQATVTGAKPLIEQKIDRLVFNVDASVTSTGSNALEVLEKTPRVAVGQQGIAIVGKSTVQVMVNDRLIRLGGDDLAAYLRSINANNIASIEVIPNPPAKYDAAGNSGLINIRLKKNPAEGLNGSLYGTYTQSFYATGEAGGNFNFRKKALNLYGNVSKVNGATRPVEHLTIFYPFQTWSQYDYRKDKTNSTAYQLGADLTLGKRSLLGFAYNGFYRVPGMEENIQNTVTGAGGVPDSLILTRGNTDTRIVSNEFNLNYVYSLNAAGKKKLTLNANHLDYTNNKDRLFDMANYFPDGKATGLTDVNTNSGKQDIAINTAQADIDWPTTLATWSTGGKITSIDTKSNNLFSRLGPNGFVVDSGNSDSYKYTENTQALYLNGDRSLGKWEIQAGARGEFTQYTSNSISTHNITKQHYFKLFPTLFVQRSIGKDHTLTASVGRRIDRPGYFQLNPFKWFLTDYQYTVGNPFLQPSFSTNVELDYSWANKLFFSVYYQHAEAIVDQTVQSDPATNVTILQWNNIGVSSSAGLTAGTNLSLTPWWSTNTELIIYSYWFNANFGSDRAAFRKTSAYFRTNNRLSFDKKKKFTGELNFWYQFNDQQGYSLVGHSCVLSAGVRTVLSPHSTLALNGADIFRTAKPHIVTRALNTVSTNDNYYDVQKIRMTYTYRFGRSSVKAKRQRSSGDEDERGRIK